MYITTFLLLTSKHFCSNFWKWFSRISITRVYRHHTLIESQPVGKYRQCSIPISFFMFEFCDNFVDEIHFSFRFQFYRCRYKNFGKQFHARGSTYSKSVLTFLVIEFLNLQKVSLSTFALDFYFWYNNSVASLLPLLSLLLWWLLPPSFFEFVFPKMAPSNSFFI